MQCCCVIFNCQHAHVAVTQVALNVVTLGKVVEELSAAFNIKFQDCIKIIIFLNYINKETEKVKYGILLRKSGIKLILGTRQRSKPRTRDL